MKTSKRSRRHNRRRAPATARVLVVYKKTYLMEVREKNDERMMALIEQGHESVAKVVQSHREHEATLAAVGAELSRRGIQFLSVPREKMAQELHDHQWDMVATVGGDGTVLEASHYVEADEPILGINSAVCTSHGHFCRANLGNLGQVLEEIVSGRRKPLHLMRLQLTLDGKPLPELVVNEVLIRHGVLGETARYILHVNKLSVAQKSDGLFLGPAAGSTGWMRSYGATILPVTSRRFQHLTRGLIVQKPEDKLHRHGMLRRSDRVKVVSTMPDGIIMIDGRHIRYPFPRGSELLVSPAAVDLRAYMEPDVNDRYLALV